MRESGTFLTPAAAAAVLLPDVRQLDALTPEVSPRRYFRARSEAAQPWLLVLSPNPAPLATTDFLLTLGIHVPRIGATMEGAYLVEDLGDRHLVAAPTMEHYERLLQDWLKLAYAKLPLEHPNRVLALNEELFLFELGMFRDCYLLNYRKLDLNASDLGAVEDAITELAHLASVGPQCLQHRDFHSRNILLPTTASLAWIDHQDLRSGPLYYDLASLYTDAYASLSDAVYDLLRAFVIPLGADFGLHAASAEERFLLSALQRVLKALGTFGKVLEAGRKDFLAAEIQARQLALALLDQLAIYPTLRNLVARS